MPLLDKKAYTKSPTTTVGRASKVFKMVMRKRFPWNSLKAMKKPAGIPTILARNVDMQLNFKERPTTSKSSGSIDPMSIADDKKLSTKNSMILMKCPKKTGSFPAYMCRLILHPELRPGKRLVGLGSYTRRSRPAP